jgi:Fe-S cluster assembly ATP-binding protein
VSEHAEAAALLRIEDLRASVGDTEILHGINLVVRPGEVHAVMGPNGAGKSTLAGLLAGRAEYSVTGGRVIYDGTDLLSLSPEERAWAGLFLGFQYPVEIPGVSNLTLLKAAVNARRKAQKQPEIEATELLTRTRECARLLKMEPAMLTRGVNAGFSGGEKKRNEILQMLVLEPRLAILDETDSGLDIDALRIVADGISSLRAPHRAVLLVTHYHRLLDHVVPDFVHVLAAGRIRRSGGPELARELEQRGYEWITAEPA